MLARFRILLPFAISVRQGDRLDPYEFDGDGYHIKVYPPYRTTLDPSQFDSTPLAATWEGLKPADRQTAIEGIRMDSTATIQASGLQIDFIKETFDRRIQEGQPQAAESDPPTSLAFSVANELLKRIRSVGRAAVIRLLTPESTTWNVRYLTDDEHDLPQDPALFRSHGGKRFQIRLAGLNEAIWNAAQQLPPGFEPAPWESVLLDAEALLPEIGPSIAAVYSALEVFIVWVLDQLAARGGLPADLWEWINDRAGHYEKEPSVAERFDVLLRVLTGRSLKEEVGLWQSFRNVQNARHTFIHEGVPLSGPGRPLTEAEAYALVGQAKAIVDWVEGLLPIELRRPQPVNATFQIIPVL